MTDYLVKGDRPADDPIFSLNQEATARASQGEAILNATIGVLLNDDGSLAVLPSVKTAVSELSAAQWASYAPIAGPANYLESLQDDLFAGYPELRAASTAVATPGGTGAIRHAITTFTHPDQAALTSSFYWSPYAIIAEENGRRIETFEMFDPARGSSELWMESFDKALGDLTASQGRALVILNDPCHNPTGYSLTEAEWQAVSDIVARHGHTAPITLLIDSAYAAYAPHGMTPMLRACKRLLGHALVLVAWSASKSFTAYGMRVGALIAMSPDADERRRVGAALSYACRGTWSNCNHGGMAAIARILGTPSLRQQVLAERAEFVRLLDERVRVFNDAARLKGLRYPRYDGGFFVTVFCRDAKSAAEALKAQGVFVVPQKGALRSALCAVPTRDIPRLVDALATVRDM